MARVSQEVLNRYRFVGEYDKCYYCGSPPTAFETTPHHSVISDPEYAEAIETMEWVKVRVCTSCNQRIWYANVALTHSAKREGARKGLMSLEAKERLCQGRKWLRMKDESAFKLSGDGRQIIPAGYFRHDDGRIFIGPDEWTEEELMAIQGPMAMKMVGLPAERIADCFYALVVADQVAQVINVEKARKLLKV